MYRDLGYEDLPFDLSIPDRSIDHYIIPAYKKGISTAALDDICEIPGVSVMPMANGIQLRVVSSSAEDTLLGSGLRLLEVAYLDTALVFKTETLSMSGLTPVNTVATDIHRVLWMHALALGSGIGAGGNISLTNVAGTVTYEYLKAGGNRSLSSHFTVPAGKECFLLGRTISSVKQDMSIRIRATVHYHDRHLLLPGVFVFHEAVVLKDGATSHNYAHPLSFPAGCDIKVSAIADTANGDCSASYEILLVDLPV